MVSLFLAAKCSRCFVSKQYTFCLCKVVCQDYHLLLLFGYMCNCTSLWFLLVELL